MSGGDPSFQGSLPLALALTTLSGLATGLGAIFVIFMQDGAPTPRSLGLSQGLAAGFMISVSLLEILPEALSTLEIWLGLVYVSLGTGAIYLLKHLLPEPDLTIFIQHQSTPGGGGGDNDHHMEMSSGSSSRSFGLGGSGTPSNGGGGTGRQLQQRKKVLFSGLLTALSLALHNCPEGIATFAASLKGLSFGLPLTISIALHNVPEGASVALPIYFGTRSKKMAVGVAFLSGLAEPLGVLFVAFLGPASLTQHSLACLLAVVAGIMGALSVFELIPQCVELTSKKDALGAAGVGFVVMAVVLAAVHALDM